MFGKSEDSVLIKRAIQGSEKAWLTLVKRYENRVYNHALRMSGNPDDALDILQNTFIAVFRNLESYRGEASFPTWLIRIAIFRSTDLLRKRKNLSESFEETTDQNNQDEPEHHLQHTRDNRRVLKMLQSLPLESRQIVELKFFQNFTFDEIAGQLGISSNTAKSRLYASLKKMRETAPKEIALRS